jgi:hypothetical protein
MKRNRKFRVGTTEIGSKEANLSVVNISCSVDGIRYGPSAKGVVHRGG